jgi:hypothetical protein
MMEKMSSILNSNNSHYQNDVIDKTLKIVTWNANRLAKHSDKKSKLLFLIKTQTYYLFLKCILPRRAISKSRIHFASLNVTTKLMEKLFSS